MKFISQLFIAALTLALASALSDDGYDRITCTDRLNSPNFIEECVKLYCKCMFLCDNPEMESMSVNGRGKSKKHNEQLSILECFEKNGCDPEADVQKMIPCSTCIVEQPEGTKTCAGYQIGVTATE